MWYNYHRKRRTRNVVVILKLKKLTEVAEWLQPFRKMWTGKLNQLDTLLDELQAKPKK